MSAQQRQIDQLLARVRELERQAEAPQYISGSWVRAKRGGGDNHFLFTLTGTIASGSGLATIRELADDADVETGVSLRDPLGHFDGLTSGHRGYCFLSNGEYYALGPYVTRVRWDDPDLEYSRDNATTWTNIDTAEDCA